MNQSNNTNTTATQKEVQGTEEPPLEGQVGYKGPAFLRKLILGLINE